MKTLIIILMVALTLAMYGQKQKEEAEKETKKATVLKKPTNFTKMPEVDLSDFTAEQKTIILKRANAEMCDCGCKLTLAECRNDDTSCRKSLALVGKLIEEISGKKVAPPKDKALGKGLDMKFTATDGTEVDLAKMKGKVVLIDFWATWCGPCVAEIPNVKKTYEKLHSKGFEIIGISLDSNEDKLTQFIKKKDMPWPQYFDGKGWKNKISTQHGIRSIPAMWLVDKEGNLVDKKARTNLEEKVEKLLAD
ncbi:MAG: TlpA disulfide reductase family protein [Verrucomicrobia bacterium]|nr:TlpA family protein disulfide reductase [Verrucomicrobiota bacterium]MDA1046751.1 TlpA disulfide reductase family protein [Verrucomicrobiota bacterium]